MANLAVEVVGSRNTKISIDDPRKEIIFFAKGSTDDETMRAFVETQLAANIKVSSQLFGTLTLVIQDYDIKQLQIGGDNWEGVARYARRQPRKTGDLYLTFDSCGATAHQTTSKETVDSYKDPAYTGDIPNFHNAIGVDKDTVHGVDIGVSIYKFTLAWYPPVALMTQDYLDKLKALTFHKNAAEWFNWSPEEVLFLGATGQSRSLDDWELLFHFIGEENQQELSVGDIKHIFKNGHDYLWLRFAPSKDANIITHVPRFAYLERMYDLGNFSDLGLDGLKIRNLANPMSISPSGIPDGVHSLPYSQDITVTGGTPAVTLSITSGALPTGWTLSGTTIAGTTTQTGTFSVTVRATDADGQTLDQSYVFAVT